MTAVTVIGIIVGFLVFDLAIRRFREGRRSAADDVTARARPTLSDFLLPIEYFFHPGHSWARIQEPGLVKVGVDDFVQKTLGRFDRVHLPPNGHELRAGAPAITLCQGSKKATIPSPVSGVVTGVNEALRNDPDLLRERPYEAGWAFKVRPTSLQKDLSRLSIADGAVDWLKNEVRAFRDFVLEIAGRDSPIGATLADGGAPVTGVLEGFGTDSWRQFQERFLK